MMKHIIASAIEMLQVKVVKPFDYKSVDISDLSNPDFFNEAK